MSVENADFNTSVIVDAEVLEDALRRVEALEARLTTIEAEKKLLGITLARLCLVTAIHEANLPRAYVEEVVRLMNDTLDDIHTIDDEPA